MSSPEKKKSSKKKDKPKEKGSGLPAEIEDIRTRVTFTNKSPVNTNAIDDADAFRSMGFDNSLDINAFKRDLKIQFISSDEETLVFDISGISAAVANAFRRILIAEVPTMAIEKVVFYQNTSIIQDEVLAHRLGLIPIKADPRDFQYHYESGGVPNEKNTLVFTLEVECTNKVGATETSPNEEKYNNSVVLSNELKWVPQGKQATRFAHKPISTVHEDIVVAKLRPGQSIEAELHCVKGLGKTHAKWSPVATASYRLLPEITLPKPITGEDAKALVSKCPLNVFDIEDIGGVSRAVVKTPRNCSMCRECIREPGWEERVKLQRVRDHFIFSIESTGIYTPTELFKECVKVLAAKCQHVLDQLNAEVVDQE